MWPIAAVSSASGLPTGLVVGVMLRVGDPAALAAAGKGFAFRAELDEPAICRRQGVARVADTLVYEFAFGVHGAECCATLRATHAGFDVEEDFCSFHFVFPLGNPSIVFVLRETPPGFAGSSGEIHFLSRAILRALFSARSMPSKINRRAPAGNSPRSSP